METAYRAGAGLQVVTFLFTDVEGSTRLWETDPDAMSKLLQRHDAMIGEAVRAHSGAVFKSVGDAICAAFPNAASALKAAIQIQRDLRELREGAFGPLRVRVAVHTGEAQVRDNDFFGASLSRVARLMSIAHGGQVLFSEAAVASVGDSKPEGVSFRDLGAHKLKDLQRPEQVFQMLHPDLESEFPALRSLSSLPNNLPQQASSFIGREAELSEVKRLVAEWRLTTLVGSGGCGKTRLAIQAAAELLSEFRDGVWIVELAPLQDPNLAASAIAHVLGVKEPQQATHEEAIVERLRDRRLLLILDNCEHVLRAISHLADRIIKGASGATLLATSLEALGIPGERTYRVPSLVTPTDVSTLSAESALKYDAVRLLLERAKAVRPEFEITDSTAAAAVEVCRRLDGIPLAIELAAARLQSLTLNDVASRLDDRFRLLTGGSRAALPKQQTLRALIEWSHGLLEPKEQAMLQRLAVFSGGWTLQAAEAVCSDAEELRSGLTSGFAAIDHPEILDLLTSLVQKSLVVFEERAQGEARYALLETVRQFALEKLEGQSDPFLPGAPLSERLRTKHLTHFVDVAARYSAMLTGQGQAEAIAALDVEHANMRAALEFSKSDPASLAQGLTLVGHLGRFWMIRAYVREGLSHVESLLRLASERREEDDAAFESAVAAAQSCRGFLLWIKGDYDGARAAFEACLKARQAQGDEAGKAAAYAHLAVVAISSLDFDRAHDWIIAGLALNKKLRNESGVASALTSLGVVLEKQGDLVSAEERHREALEIWLSSKNDHARAVSLNNLANLARKRGDTDGARRLALESLELRLGLNDRNGVLWSMEAAAKIAADEGRHRDAATLLGAAQEQRLRADLPLAAIDRPEVDHAMSLAREGLGDEQFERAVKHGTKLSLDDGALLARGLLASTA